MTIKQIAALKKVESIDIKMVVIDIGNLCSTFKRTLITFPQTHSIFFSSRAMQ